MSNFQVSRPCTHLCCTVPGRSSGSRLLPGAPATHEKTRLWLLPSGSDQVHGISSRGTRVSTPLTGPSPENNAPGVRIRPCYADCRSPFRVQGTAGSPPSTAD
jgi:hypothetical protein